MDAKPKKMEPEEREEDENVGADLAESATVTLFFDPEHLNQLVPAVQKSSDPSQVIGTALGQILLVAYNKLNQADLGVDDSVWASDDGVIDRILDEVVGFFTEMGAQVDPNTVAQAVLNVLKDSPVAQGPQGEQQPPMTGVPR